MVFAVANQPFVNYYNALPENILPAVGQSALYTFSVAVFFSACLEGKQLNMTRPLLKAGVAALASTIHALLTPLFNKIFDTEYLGFWDEFAKSSVVGLAASVIVNYATTSKVDLTAFHLIYLISLNSVIAFCTAVKVQPMSFIQDNSIYMCFGVS